MKHSTNHRPPPFGRLTPEQLAEALARNTGRLEVVVLACRGLIHERGREALYLGWVLVDVIKDLEGIEGLIRGG